jgi:hypothetical protein
MKSAKYATRNYRNTKMNNMVSKKTDSDIAKLLDREKRQLEDFIQLFSLKGTDYNNAKTQEENWTAKEVLAHITFWHESFARNISDAGEKREPRVLKGSMNDVINRGVRENRDVPIDVLLRRTRKAQRTIEKHIFDNTIGLIPYKQGSRPYTRAEHLDVVTRHINIYFWRVVQAYLKHRINYLNK